MSEDINYEQFYKAKIKGETHAPQREILDLDLLLKLLERPFAEQNDVCNTALYEHDADAFHKTTITAREVRILLAQLN